MLAASVTSIRGSGPGRAATAAARGGHGMVGVREQIRIHGVAGTPPERILDTVPRALTRKSDAGVSVELYEAVDPVPPGFDRLRSISWSSLTSGSPGQAFNVLLTPFLLTNTAGWMAPQRGPVAGVVGIAAHRVAALVSTAVMAMGLCWVTFVVPATGCRLLATTDLGRHGVPNDLRCQYSVLAVEVGWITDGVGWWRAALLALVVVSAVPCWSLWDSRRFRRRLAVAIPDGVQDDREGPAGWPRRVLDDEQHPATTALRLSHWLISVAMLMCTVGIDRRSSSTYLAGVAATSVAFAVAAGAPAPGVHHRSGWRTFAGVAVVFAAVPIAVAWSPPRPWQTWDGSPGQLVANFHAVNWITVVGAVAVCVLVPLMILDQPDSRWAGFNAASVTALSLLTAGVLAAGLALLAIQLLGVTGLRASIGNNAPLTVAFVDAALLVTWAGLRAVRRAMPRGARGPLPAARALAHVARDRMERRLAWLGVAQLVALALYLFAVHLAPPLPDRYTAWMHPPPTQEFWLAAPAILLAVGTAAEALRLIHRAIGKRSKRLLLSAVIVAATALFVWRAWADVQATFDWLALALPTTIAIQLFVQGIRKRDSRRGAAIVRDATGFWPRSFHPLVPRPYGAVAIASLQSELIRPSRDDEVTYTVVCGHSQGSVLVLSAAAGLSHTARLRTGVLVYGSPVSNLYQAAFPNHFGPQWLNDTAEALDGRLRNLYRDTDPIAAPTAGENQSIDVRLDDHDDGLRMHSGYETETKFRDVAEALSQTLATTLAKSDKAAQS